MAHALVTVGGYAFPEPSTYNGISATIVDSARNTDGYVIGSVIREDVAKVELTWNMLTVDQWSRILQCFDSKYGGSFYNNVTFFNQTSGSFETREMYVSDRSAPMWRRDPETGEVKGWLGCSLNLIEV